MVNRTRRKERSSFTFGNLGGSVGGPVDSSRSQLTFLLNSDGATVANYQPGNYTGTLNASAWPNSIGIAGSLAQATAGNQPPILPFTGQKYLANFGVNGNYVSTPATGPNTLTGDMTAVFTVALNSITPANTVLATQSATANINWIVEVAVTTGAVMFYYSVLGTTLVPKTSSATLGSVGIVDGQKFDLAIYHDVDNGASGNDVKFYYSTDGRATWTQLGTTKTTAGAVTRYASTAAIRAWGYFNDTEVLAGKGYRAELYSGDYIAGTGTPVADFNASDWSETSTNGATQASSTTGETWTLNNTGTKLAQIVASPQLLFDGAASWMQTAPFTLNQPTTVYMVGKQVTWTSLDYIYDGITLGTGQLYQNTATPKVRTAAGTATTLNPDWGVNTYGIVSVSFNGASSFSKVNNNAALVSDAGAANMGGLTLGANATPTGYSNIQVKEILIRNVADSATTQAQIISLLNAIHGVY